jgi:hypothetical protein
VQKQCFWQTGRDQFFFFEVSFACHFPFFVYKDHAPQKDFREREAPQKHLREREESAP